MADPTQVIPIITNTVAGPPLLPNIYIGSTENQDLNKYTYAAIGAIIGAMIGAVGAIVAQVLTHWLTAERDRKKLLRDKGELIISKLLEHQQILIDEHMNVIYEMDKKREKEVTASAIAIAVNCELYFGNNEKILKNKEKIMEEFNKIISLNIEHKRRKTNGSWLKSVYEQEYEAAIKEHDKAWKDLAHEIMESVKSLNENKLAPWK